MKTVNIRQIHHDFASVLDLVAQGEEVTVLKRSRPVARICPPLPVEDGEVPVVMPDFAARSKAMFGKRQMTNVVLKDRESQRW